MRLSWNEIKARAARFADEWKDARYERGESQTFYNEFFEVFGVTRRRVASFEEPVKKLGDERGFIDLFWKGVLLVEQKSAGRDLTRAKQQALDYFPGLKEHELPRFVLVSDFQTFELYDLEEDTTSRFTLRQLPNHVEEFGFILGVQKRSFRDQDPVNIQASEIMGKLHDALKESGYEGHELERFLVRLVFCLFADDTGIFEPRDIFSTLITQRTNPDGSDTGLWLSQLFDVLNKPVTQRQKSLDQDLAQFPYVNGDLFQERLSLPSFNADMRSHLIDALDFSWDAISPAIFGSLFQSVMNRKERRAQGAHYTTEKNILKVIEPLFLDDLRAEFKRLADRRDSGRRKALEAFHQKLSTLRFFDPACGCGNFLIISYRELRLLEIDILKALRKDTQLKLDVADLSRIDVDQFYGIEVGEFPARIAEIALWMMDHIMNNKLSLEFGESYVRIPLKKSPHIRPADALEVDWSGLIAPADCTYILGNPPFGGAKYQSDKQRAQVRRIAQLGGSGGTLDYVTAWFLKAGEFLRQSHATIGFVATNSITQGEQVAQLWPVLFDRHGLEISFAHRTFAWGSDARGMAHVHVVIIGLTRRDQEPPVKRLFSYSDIQGDPTESEHQALTPYLFDAGTVVNRHLVVEETSRPLCEVPQLVIGSKPIDDGNYIFDDEQRSEFIHREPKAAKFLHPYIGSKEFINGIDRWILALDNASPADLRAMPAVMERIAAVKSFRRRSISPPTQELANTPTRYHVTVVPDRAFLVIPESSSERREYVPIAWLQPPVIPSSLVRVLLDADLWHFSILTSAMHMAWLRQIGGRLKSDYRYSVGIVYNTFPWPEATDQQRAKIRSLAQVVLNARLQFPNSTLADIYDVDAMPPPLRKAHHALDDAVDNVLILGMDLRAFESGDPRWMTYQQAQEKQWQVRKGERSTTIFFAKPLEVDDEEPEDGRKTIKILKHYAVFHASQIDGIPAYKAPTVEDAPWTRPEAADIILKNSGANIRIGGDRAFYSPATDHIQLPPESAFRGTAEFATTGLHELGHWTGHPSRLNRPLQNRFGSAAYAMEELRAELASAFVATTLGIPTDIPQHASYISSWIKALKDDKREIFRAAADAQRIADMELGFHPDYAAQIQTEITAPARASRSALAPMLAPG